MNDLLSGLLRRPVVVAPMAGGPSTTDLVIAASAAGALGFLAAGYKTAAAMRAEIDTVTAAGAGPFGVNVFVPGSPAPDQAAVASYVADLATDAKALGVQLGDPGWNDDDWEAKIAALLGDPPAVVSFTFGSPGPDIIAALKVAGGTVWVTVTAPDEAVLAAEHGADGLCVQASAAGAHRGTFSDRLPGAPEPSLPPEPPLSRLLRDVAAVTGLPLVAAGGIMSRDDSAAALAAGAVAVQCGTAFLRCPESGAHPVHKAALAEPRFSRTAVTRAFSGRPARGLVNRFMLDHPGAPPGYPEINNATRPLRAAAAVAGDADGMSLYAGEGFRAATTRPAAEIVELLSP
jgi:nitronate monooxygenase